MMSGKRMTSIGLPGLENGDGLADWDLKTPEEMIAMLRNYAARNKATAEAILAAADEDFRVETYTGVYVQRNRTILQKGRDKP